MPQIIGIGGVRRSGKSTLARRLKEKLASKQVLSLDLDEYVFDIKQNMAFVLREIHRLV